MPAEPCFVPSVKSGRGGEWAMYLSPSMLPAATQWDIARKMGTRANPLGITASMMMRHFAHDDISAVGFVFGGRSANQRCAKACGCLQYYDWMQNGTPQMWLTDLYRVGPKPVRRSLVGELLDRFDACLRDCGIRDLWVMVDTAGEADSNSARKLQSVYKNYGFRHVCVSESLNSIVMKRTIG